MLKKISWSFNICLTDFDPPLPPLPFLHKRCTLPNQDTRTKKRYLEKTF